jgi:hypothetical protein
MSDDMAPALARLNARLQQQLTDVKNTKKGINALHAAFEKPIPYPDVDREEAGITTIRRGMFYGQPLATCVRQILEMRNAAQLGAGSVNEIFAALKEGGYAFETKDDENAKSGLRQSMRKNPIFHRIPSGEWGLLAWYPNAKVEKDDDDNGNNGKKPEQPAAQGQAPGAAPAQTDPTPQPAVATSKPPIRKKKEKPDEVAATAGASAPSNEQAVSAT